MEHCGLGTAVEGEKILTALFFAFTTFEPGKRSEPKGTCKIPCCIRLGRSSVVSVLIGDAVGNQSKETPNCVS